MKTHFLFFTIGLLLGLFLSFMYQTVLIDVPAPVTSKQVVKSLEKDVAKSEVNYAKSVDSLKGQSVRLQVQLNDTKIELTKAKQKVNSLQISIYDLLDQRLENEAKGNIETNPSCDSLVVTVEELMQSSSEKDSLYERVTVNLEDQLKNKDSTLSVKDKQYLEVKSAFAKSIEGQKELIDQNKLLNKEAKRQKFKSKVLTAALFIFAGAATNYFLHH
jgi:hypothetical protein